MDNLLIISSAILWVAVAALSILVFALARQVGVLYKRVAPAGALMVSQQLKVGERAPTFVLETLTGTTIEIGAAQQLLFFLAPDCPISRSLIPVLKSVRRSEGSIDVVLASDGGNEAEHLAFVDEHRLRDFPYVRSELLGRGYGVSKVPYAVLIDETASIAAMGIVNSREHLESLFEAKERRVGSIQDYLARRDGGGVQFYQAGQGDASASTDS